MGDGVLEDFEVRGMDPSSHVSLLFSCSVTSDSLQPMDCKLKETVQSQVGEAGPEGQVRVWASLPPVS